MSDWTEKVLAGTAKKELKQITLDMYDKALTIGCTPDEARAVTCGLVPEEIAFLRILVEYWLDKERVPASS